MCAVSAHKLSVTERPSHLLQGVNGSVNDGMWHKEAKRWGENSY